MAEASSGTRGRGLAGLLVALLAACGARTEDRPRHLIWISIDTLRADRLGCYGNPRELTPHLDALAAQGVLVEQASAPSPWTKPSHAALFTGLYPGRNGVVGFEYPLLPRCATAAEMLGAAGFQTAAVVSNSVLTLHGLPRGFQHFEFTERGPGPEPSDVTERALAWLAEREPRQPLFLLVHYNDVHADYRSLPRFQEGLLRPYSGRATGRAHELLGHALGVERLGPEDSAHVSDLYDAAVRQTDDQVGQLLAGLEREGLLEDSLIVVTSDHGEEFLEHGGVQHGLTQYEESVRVPLLFRAPGLGSGLRCGVPASLVDVLPTCLEILGQAVPPRLDGRSLLAYLRDPGREAPPRALFYEADCAVPEPGESGALRPGQSRAVRLEGFKLHRELGDEGAALFDLAEDPGELRDVSAEQPGRLHELDQVLDDYLNRERRSSPPVPLTEEELGHLRALGYAGEN